VSIQEARIITPSEQAIIVNGSQILRDLLRHVIEKYSDLVVASEIDDLEGLPAIVDEPNIIWLFIILSPGEQLPERQITALLLYHPKIRIVGFWTDGSHVQVEWLGLQRRIYEGLTLEQLTRLLQLEMSAIKTEVDDLRMIV
jgi:hypothetical protein